MTDHFEGRIEVEQWGAWWVLRRAFRFACTDSRLCVLVPAGFVTDFASVPRAFWNLAAPADPEFSGAALIHDRLYETHESDQATADEAFFRAMAVRGTPRWKRRLMWAAVRSFGGSAYASGPVRQAERLAAYRRRDHAAMAACPLAEHA